MITALLTLLVGLALVGMAGVYVATKGTWELG